MVVIHKAFRREFALLPAVIGSVAAGDRRQAREVRRHADLMFGVLHDHHDCEDTLLWPLLHERVRLHGALIHRMEAQHEVVAESVETLRRALAYWSSRGADPLVRDRIVLESRRLHAALVEHLDLEEAEILPLIHAHLTVAEWLAPQKAAAQKGPSGLRPLMLLVGAILEDASTPEQAWFLNEMPAVARPIWRTVGIRMYAKHIRTIRGEITGTATIDGRGEPGGRRRLA